MILPSAKLASFALCRTSLPNRVGGLKGDLAALFRFHTGGEALGRFSIEFLSGPGGPPLQRERLHVHVKDLSRAMNLEPIAGLDVARGFRALTVEEHSTERNFLLGDGAGLEKAGRSQPFVYAQFVHFASPKRTKGASPEELNAFCVIASIRCDRDWRAANFRDENRA